jgi:hypothetical protein
VKWRGGGGRTAIGLRRQEAQLNPHRLGWSALALTLLFVVVLVATL